MATYDTAFLHYHKPLLGRVAMAGFEDHLNFFHVGVPCFTTSYTVCLLVVGIEADNAGVAGMAFGGIALTQAVSHFYNDDTEFWYLKDPNGTADVVVNMTGPTG